MFDVDKIREDFPILSEKIKDKPLVYLDNGATTQKPQCVIDAITECYTKYNSNIHRGVHTLSQKATVAYEDARDAVKEFINAADTKEIVFTSGATGAINLVAFSFGEKYISKGDEIIVSEMEHHANIVPWQMLCERKGAKLKVIPFNDEGELILSELDNLITDRTKLISVTHISNTLGTINPIKQIIDKAHSHDIPVLIDGAQAIHHVEVDVQELDCDFYVFSGHKIYGPTGIGVLYGKEKWLNRMPPYQGGGDMIDSVSFEKTTYNELPFKFEAGTTNYVGAIGLGAAIRYVKNLGIKNIAAYEDELLEYATQKLSSIEGLKIYGTAKNKASVISFLLDGIHFLDAGTILNHLNIAVRTGTHCTEPIMQHYGIDGTIRASFSFYNKKEEIDSLYDGLLRVMKMFK